MPQPHNFPHEAAEVIIAARDNKNKALKNNWLDAWFELYPKDYNKYYNQASGKEQQMILWFFKGHGRKSVQEKIWTIMELLNKKVIKQKSGRKTTTKGK